jgi:hypothetical protein
VDQKVNLWAFYNLTRKFMLSVIILNKNIACRPIALISLKSTKLPGLGLATPLVRLHVLFADPTGVKGGRTRPTHAARRLGVRCAEGGRFRVDCWAGTPSATWVDTALPSIETPAAATLRSVQRHRPSGGDPAGVGLATAAAPAATAWSKLPSRSHSHHSLAHRKDLLRAR